MLKIRRLSPETEVQFLEFMDGPAFESQPKWLGCYCQEYLNTKEQNETATPETNRATACKRIRSRVMNGYLAFESEADDAKVIGWLSANDHNNYKLLPPLDGERTATVICFSIQKDHQGKGIAEALLSYAIEDLGKRGFNSIQGAPLANGEFHDWAYRGPLSMFLKLGFEKGPMLDKMHVLVTRPLS